jgi:hypothetical protein
MPKQHSNSLVNFLNNVDAASGILEVVKYMVTCINNGEKTLITETELTAALMLPATHACVKAQIDMLRDPDFLNEVYHGE